MDSDMTSSDPRPRPRRRATASDDKSITNRRRTATEEAPPRPAVPRSRRPRRGTPDETRARLLAAAARVFNRAGYHGTDSNRLARAAGYAPGSFYKHFADKRAAFVAAYADWVTAEWEALADVTARPGSVDARAERIVRLLLDWHRRWRIFRASLRVLVATDAVVRRAHRRQRRRQLAWLRALRERQGQPARPRADDVLLLLTLERVCDAAADGELGDLGVAPAAAAGRLRALVAAALAPPA
jgi:AcrR family transcriptional regulator